ncbi:hypothetical protein ABBQ38_010650 [Trebouxia sp. C0009 RCD-2024]
MMKAIGRPNEGRAHRSSWDDNISRATFQSNVVWEVSHISLMSESRTFYKTLQVGSYCWNVKLFTQGSQEAGHFAVDLAVKMPLLCPTTGLELCLIPFHCSNQQHERTIRQAETTPFSASKGWLIRHFASQATVLSEGQGFVDNDTLRLRVHITITEHRQVQSKTRVGFKLPAFFLPAAGMCAVALGWWAVNQRSHQQEDYQLEAARKFPNRKSKRFMIK